MLNIELDQTAIATAILGNIGLQIGIQIQKYTKKKIINLALHGLSTESVQTLWMVGLTLLIVSECFYFIAYGLGREFQMLPIGVFTIISSTTLPPLFFETETHTIIGALLCQLGVLIMIMLAPSMAAHVSHPIFDLNAETTRYCICGEIFLGLALILTRAYKPANCCLKLAANCGLSALMGSYTVMLVEVLSNLDEHVSNLPWLISVVLITSILKAVLIYESLQIFPVWQVVPHHFAMFVFFITLNQAIIFRRFDKLNTITTGVLLLSHICLICGVWISAKPHLDFPTDINKTGLLPELKQRVLCQWRTQSALVGEDSMSVPLGPTHLCTPYGHSCLRNEYCQLMHARHKEREGFASISGLC